MMPAIFHWYVLKYFGGEKECRFRITSILVEVYTYCSRLCKSFWTYMLPSFKSLSQFPILWNLRCISFMTLKEVTEILTRKESIHLWNAILLKKACGVDYLKFISIENLFQMMDFKHSVLFRGVLTIEIETTLSDSFGQKQAAWKSNE